VSLSNQRYFIHFGKDVETNFLLLGTGRETRLASMSVMSISICLALGQMVGSSLRGEVIFRSRA
jgi:hypothetical protein